MEIRDVVGNLRVDILSLKLQMSSMRSEMEMIERFTWNLIRLLANGETDIVITVELEETEDAVQPQEL